TGYGILQFYQNIYEHDTGKRLASVYGIYGYFSFLHYLISIISILVMVRVFQNLKARQLESVGQKLLQSQIIDMKRHIKEVEKLYQDIRLLRHDMGNHIQTIENLLDNNDRKDAIEYAARLRKDWQDVSVEIKSGNPVTDVVLLEKKKEAEEQHIKFFCDFHYPERTKIDAFDVSIILNNALDNSMEAVNGTSPYISISSYQKNNIFMILISNSFEGNIVIDDDTELPVSTKKGIGHGLGLANVRRVAQMYLGEIAFEQEEGKATLTVMLQIE
ncbi:MAG: GHKL domain-containing protein, partial [Bacillota bacterium]|nr:GHKL domain-containing protein [Bacillota bacterium]